MKNPWEDIPLNEYENHMKLDSVMQLQAMNEMMKDQLNIYPIKSVMILGIAGGNGLEHIHKEKLDKVYGVDINSDYLKEVKYRYSDLNKILECLCVDLTDDIHTLPNVDMIIANLLIEYIGYTCFQKVIYHVNPKYISCIIQINREDTWISDSPYLHTFDKLDEVHHQLEEETLKNAMNELDYVFIKKTEYPLPNGKMLVQLDFKK